MELVQNWSSALIAFGAITSRSLHLKHNTPLGRQDGGLISCPLSKQEWDSGDGDEG